MKPEKTNEDFIQKKDFEGLLKKNERFLEVAAAKFKQDEDGTEDLIQVGRIAMYQTYLSHKPDSGAYWAYAKQAIQYAMWNHLNKFENTVHIPIAKKSEHRQISIDKDYKNDNANTSSISNLKSLLKADEPIDPTRYESLYKVLEMLAPREKGIMMKYYGFEPYEEMTLEQIGDELGLTKERIRQIIKKILEKVKVSPLFPAISKINEK